jgi:hypothetical protein
MSWITILIGLLVAKLFVKGIPWWIVLLPVLVPVLAVLNIVFVIFLLEMI